MSVDHPLPAYYIMPSVAEASLDPLAGDIMSPLMKRQALGLSPGVQGERDLRIDGAKEELGRRGRIDRRRRLLGRRDQKLRPLARDGDDEPRCQLVLPDIAVERRRRQLDRLVNAPE